MLDIYHQGDYTKVAGVEMRDVEEVSGATDRHLKAILDTLGPLPEAARRLRVVLDSCNGAGSIAGPKLLEQLGAEVFTINTTPDGSFPRGAEPVPENLGALCAAVKEHHADIGFAQDMDADRLAIVSEQGTPIGEDSTLVLATAYVLSEEPGAVVANLSTTMALDDVAASFGCPIFHTRIGEVNVTEEMQKQRAVIGGEGNGGVIYPRINFARDSLVAMALVMHLLAQKGKTVTQLLDQFPSYTIVKEKLVCPSAKISRVLKRVKEEYKDHKMDLRDGVKVMVPEGWFLVRGSNTEPIVRVVAEARSETQARLLVNEVGDRVRECIEA
jgi:phosphomannomutase